jgi:fumarate hydratase, class II
MSATETRIEKDSMGEMPVPADALYGASTARAVANFPIAHEPVPAAVIHAFGHLKAACAQANKDLGKLDAAIAVAIIDASNEVATGQHDTHFPVDIYQTGSGTSTNMNANEVIANIANRKLGFGIGAKGQDGAVHPNDHVNMGQSSNDTFPTAMHIAAVLGARDELDAGISRLRDALAEKAKNWDAIVKIGRTHLMDATPIRVGQVFGGFKAQVEYCSALVGYVVDDLCKYMPIGGTAVGTGINTHPEFGQKVCQDLRQRTQVQGRATIDFQEANNHVAAQAAKDRFVQSHGHLKTIAVALSKIANDIRHLGSGPRCSIFELSLPAIQPGSSIMPGKVNPVICESVMQVVCRVVGNDATVTMAGMGGVGSVYELNVAMPVMIDAFLESVKLLANVSNVFVDKLLVDLEVNEDRCRELIDQSLMMCTSLAPVIGYDNAAKLAKEAFVQGNTIRELALEQELLDADQLNELLDPDKMTRPG